MSEPSTLPAVFTQPPAPPVNSQESITKVKVGWKTTEFWLSAAAIAIPAFMISFAQPPKTLHDALLKVAAIISATLAAMGYSTSRGQVKASTSKIINPENVQVNQ